MSGPPSPGYATNSDSSAHSSPLLPFDQKPLPSTSTNQGEEDGWGASGGYDDGEGSPQYGSHSNGTAGGSRADGAVGKNGGNQAQREHGDARQSEAGPSRKRPRIEDDSSGSRNPSYSGTPQSQPLAPQHDHHHNNQAQPEPNSEIPLPHQIPLPDNSKSLYLLGLSDPEIQRRSPYQPVPRIIMHSIFGYTPRNEVSKEIGEWLLVTCRNLPGNVEIEIKFGKITPRGNPERLRLPVKTEVLIDDNAMEIGFKSDMPAWGHKSMNDILNENVRMTTDRSGHPFHPPHSYYPIQTSHTRTDDTFYPPLVLPGQDPIPDPEFVRFFGRGKRRLSKKQETNEVLECMQKVKVGHVHVLCPMEAFDFRVSVNCEFPCQVPSVDEHYSGLRRKDRVTYKHNMFQIDLTQVKTFEDNGSSAKTTHEVELEIIDAKKLLSYGMMSKRGQDIENRWEETMDSVLNTVRLLNKNAMPPAPPPGKMGPV